MKLTDIIALSKAGFKAAEIRKMIADDQQDPPEAPEPETAPEETPADDPQPEPAADDPEPDQAPAQPEPGPDYKKLYEEEKQKRIKAQRDNVNTPGPDKVSDMEIIQKLVNELL